MVSVSTVNALVLSPRLDDAEGLAEWEEKFIKKWKQERYSFGNLNAPDEWVISSQLYNQRKKVWCNLVDRIAYAQ